MPFLFFPPIIILLLAPFAHAAEIGPLPVLKYDSGKAELGRKLFFDTKLSGNGKISCATCHNPKTGFTTRKPLSDAYVSMLHFRNAPTLINTAYKGDKPYRIPWHWDGRIGTSLNDMVRDQITESQIMNMDMRIMQERLKQFPAYIEEFHEVFGEREPSNGLVRKAIPEFLRTLTSINVPFDQNKLSRAGEAGLQLFMGKAGCVRCHDGPMFSDGKPHNTGVPENREIFRDPNRHATFISVYSFTGLENYMNIRRDPGYMAVSHNLKDMGKFITPTLRELKYTAPYMHNGMFKTLEEVIGFYNKGGGYDRPGLKDSSMKPLHMTKSEKSQLKEFLLGLSGDPILVQPVKPDMNYKPLPNWLKIEN